MQFGRGARRAHGLFALGWPTVLAADPLLAEARNDPRPPRRQRQPDGSSSGPRDASRGEAEQPPNSVFTREELEELLAPIGALSRPCSRRCCAASAYPVQIVQAQRWLRQEQGARRQKRFSGIDNQN